MKYRYRHIENVPLDKLESLLNEEAKKAWELASTYTVVYEDSWNRTYSSRLNVVLKRPTKLDSME